jgi:hypothetical protein
MGALGLGVMETQTVVKTPHDTFSEWATVIGVGIFATGLSQPDLLQLPFRVLLTHETLSSSEHNTQTMALFFLIGMLPWSLKVIPGLLLDSVPLFGTRRRYYLIVGALGASLLWLLLAVVPRTFATLAAVCFCMNVFLVIASSAGGALYVEAGDRLAITDRLTSVRLWVDNFNSLVAGAFAGLLARVSFTAFAVSVAVIPLTMVPVAWRLVKEPQAAKYQHSTLQNAWTSIKIVVRTRDVWIAFAFLCFICALQSFLSPQYKLQTEVLNFKVVTIGILQSISGLGGILGAFLYGALRRKWNLRTWLLLGVACACMDPFLYLFYTSLYAAIPIDFMHGLLDVMTALAMFELAARATPANTAALGFAFIASAWNAGIPLGDNIAALLSDTYKLSFHEVMTVFSCVAVLAFPAVLLLPQSMVADLPVTGQTT